MLLIITTQDLLSPSRSEAAIDLLGKFLIGVVLFGLAAYLLVGVQSVIYSILMEYVINRNVHSSVLVVLSSAVLGLAAATPLFIRKHDDLPLLAMIGVLVGLCTGVLLRRMYLKVANQAL